MPPPKKKVFKPDGSRAANSKEILETEFDKYKDLWNASASRPACTYDGNAPYARASPQQIRRIAKTFKKKTGIAPDNWHPRHFALLSDELLQVLAMLFELLERSGHLPDQQRQVFVFY